MKKEGTQVGDIAQFHCNKNFELKGSFVSQCLASGQWSEDRVKCIRKH